MEMTWQIHPARPDGRGRDLGVSQSHLLQRELLRPGPRAGQDQAGGLGYTEPAFRRFDSYTPRFAFTSAAAWANPSFACASRARSGIQRAAFRVHLHLGDGMADADEAKIRRTAFDLMGDFRRTHGVVRFDFFLRARPEDAAFRSDTLIDLHKVEVNPSAIMSSCSQSINSDEDIRWDSMPSKALQRQGDSWPVLQKVDRLPKAPFPVGPDKWRAGFPSRRISPDAPWSTGCRRATGTPSRGDGARGDQRHFGCPRFAGETSTPRKTPPPYAPRLSPPPARPPARLPASAPVPAGAG